MPKKLVAAAYIIVILIGFVLIIFAKVTQDTFTQTVCLGLGANLVVITIAFGIVTFFIGEPSGLLGAAAKFTATTKELTDALEVTQKTAEYLRSDQALHEAISQLDNRLKSATIGKETLSGELGRIEEAREKERHAIAILDNHHSQIALVRHSKLHYRVLDNGDGLVDHSIELIATEVRVRWHRHVVGAVGVADGAATLADIGFKAWNVNRTARLSYLVADDQDRQKVILVLFDEPLVEGKVHSHSVEYRWAGVWKGLIRNHEDNGWVSNEFGRIEKLTVVIDVPQRLQVASFTPTPNVGKVRFQAERTRVEWIVEHPPQGRLSWSIRCSAKGD